MNEQVEKRIVQAPNQGAPDPSGAVISVELNPGEDVIWHWTHKPDGSSVVTGYEIIKKSERSN
jgi:hypothetical protein